MLIEKTNLPEVLLIKPKVFSDKRGFFKETWNQRVFAEAGLALDFVQDNFSKSVKHSLRGIHYQLENPQGKLIMVSSGKVFDVAVDLRKSSRTFGKWVGRTLEADEHSMIWIPPGFGHAFLVLSAEAEFQYKCTNFYDPNSERCIKWNDEGINIAWPLDGASPVLSEKDQAGKGLSEAEVYA